MDGFEIQPTEKKPRAKKAVPDFKPKLVPRPKRKPPEPQGPVVVNLGIKHTINGTPYGPGPTEVPAHLVSAILENEQHNAAEERKLFQPRAALIGRGNRVIPVASSFFDDPESNLTGASAPHAVTA